MSGLRIDILRSFCPFTIHMGRHFFISAEMSFSHFLNGLKLQHSSKPSTIYLEPKKCDYRKSDDFLFHFCSYTNHIGVVSFQSADLPVRKGYGDNIEKFTIWN